MNLNRRGFLMTTGAAALGASGVLRVMPGSVLAQDEIKTRVRVVHADTSEGTVKVSINGDLKIEELEYGQVSDFVEFEPGDVWVKIEQAGLDLFDVLFSAVYPIVPAGYDYQLVFSDEIVATQLVQTGVLPADTARARLVHASVDTPTVDVLVKGTDIVLFTNVRYPFSTDYVEFAAGTYDLQVVQSGTTTVLLELPGVVAEAGMVYDFIAAGIPGDADKPVTGIVATAAAATA